MPVRIHQLSSSHQSRLYKREIQNQISQQLLINNEINTLEQRESNKQQKKHKDRVQFLIQHDEHDQDDFWHVDVELNEELFHPDFAVHDSSGSQKMIQMCFYSGRVLNVKDSAVSLSTCNGVLNGKILVNGVEHRVQPHSDLGHVMQVVEDGAPVNCGADDSAEYDRLHFAIKKEFTVKQQLNRLFKRQDNFDGKKTKYIKMLFVNDYGRVKQFEDQKENITEATINHVSLMAKKMSDQIGDKFGMPIKIILAGIYNDNNPKNESTWLPEFKTQVEAGDLLDTFAQWREQKINAGAEGALGNNDVAQLLTDRDIGTKDNFRVNGLSNMAGVCSNRFGASVVEAPRGNNVDAQINLDLHELGHSLRLVHDGQGPAEKCDPDKFIMAAVSCGDCDQRKAKEILFSECSYEAGKSFLESSGQCLDVSPQTSLLCGNGIIDTSQGEQCDDGRNSTSGCCDMRTCQFKTDGNQCMTGNQTTSAANSNYTTNPLSMAGTCNKGKCISSCGNGKVDPGEDCDPTADGGANVECCNKNTCKFINRGQTCLTGKCDGVGNCAERDRILAAKPKIIVTQNKYFESYTVEIKTNASQPNVTVFYTLNSSTPVNDTSRSMKYDGKFTVTLQQVQEQNRRYDAEVAQYRGNTSALIPPNPYALDSYSKLYNVQVSAKAFSPDLLPSDTAYDNIELSPDAEEIYAQQLSVDDIKKKAAIEGSVGAIIGVVGVVVLTLALIYYNKDPIARAIWRKKTMESYPVKLVQKIARKPEDDDIDAQVQAQQQSYAKEIAQQSSLLAPIKFMKTLRNFRKTQTMMPDDIAPMSQYSNKQVVQSGDAVQSQMQAQELRSSNIPMDMLPMAAASSQPQSHPQRQQQQEDDDIEESSSPATPLMSASITQKHFDSLHNRNRQYSTDLGMANYVEMFRNTPLTPSSPYTPVPTGDYNNNHQQQSSEWSQQYQDEQGSNQRMSSPLQRFFRKKSFTSQSSSQSRRSSQSSSQSSIGSYKSGSKRQ
ncbi:hypothetical protein MIR68_011446 [Amoeboaphelidium protococcarum]|nr:hypothetical protein MIR68_011446 [Amoeboaphelidium protococcarum]